LIKGAGRQLIHAHIQEALLYFSRYKRGEGVPHLFRAYLETLEEERAIENYVLGLRLFEHKAVSMYLDGKRIEAIRGSEIFRRKGVSTNDIRIWIYGNREQFGLVNSMFGVFMRGRKVTSDIYMQKYNAGIINILHLMPADVRERVSRGRVEEIFSGLTPKERTALELRYGLVDGNVHSYEKMGEEMGMTAMGAMKLFKRTLKKVVDRAREFV